MTDFYLFAAFFFLGLFVALIPDGKENEPMLVHVALSSLCFVMAALWPITLAILLFRINTYKTSKEK